MYVLAATQLQLTECVCVCERVREGSGVRLDFVLTPVWITKMQGGFTARLAQPWATRATESNSEPYLGNDWMPFPCFPDATATKQELIQIWPTFEPHVPNLSETEGSQIT